MSLNSESTLSSTPLKRLLKRLEVPIDPKADYQNDRWTNRDLIPMPPERRTYKIWSFFVYWCISGMCISGYTAGSTLLAYGLTAPQAIGSLILGGFIVGLLSVACGWMGERHHIGFTVASRFTWGMRGGYFPIIIRAFMAIFWDGIQAYWGGQALAVVIGAVIPGYAHMKHTLAGGVLLLKDFIAMLIYYAGFLAIMRIPPEKLQKPFIVSSVMFGGTLIGLLAWGVSNTHSAGPLFHSKNEVPHSSIGWSMMFAITAVLGAWGGGTLGQSDWTRYSARPYAPTLSQLIAAPINIVLCATIGIIVTSCAYQITGELIWQPFVLLSFLQEFYGGTSRIRAAVFFAGLGCVCAQLGISIVLNSVSSGMDMAGLWPRYLNIRRAAYILAILGLASNPWQLLSNASTFLTVLSGFGIFLAPFTGVMLSDYFAVRRRILKMGDLYIGDNSSIYWYYHGFHWRPVISWVLGVFPTMPGLIMTVHDPTAYNSWVRVYNLTFIVGIASSFFTHWAICTISPPPGLGIGLTYHDEIPSRPESTAESSEKSWDIKDAEMGFNGSFDGTPTLNT